MKKTTLEVRGLIAMLDFLAVEKRLKALSGVVDVVMNPGGNTATVTYDETLTDVGIIARAIEDCGFHCRGEKVPRHVCVPDSTVVAPEDPRAPSAAHPGHVHHAPPGAAATL